VIVATDFIGIAAAIGSAAGVIGTIGGLIIRVAPTLRRIGHLLDDLEGEPARPGQPNPRPGVLERLDNLDRAVEEIRAQVTIDGGTSLKDVAIATREEVTDLHRKIDEGPYGDTPE
jgi:hypothetical protein